MVVHIGTQHHRTGVEGVLPKAADEARLVRALAERDGYLADDQATPGRLHDGLLDIRVRRCDMELHGSIAGEGAEASLRIRYGQPREAPHDEADELVGHPLAHRHGLNLSGEAGAEDDVRSALQDGRHQVWYLGLVVLEIGVGVDDDVGAAGQRRLQPHAEGGGQAHVALEAHHLVCAGFGGLRHSGVAGAIVDDHNFDAAYARDGTGNLGNHLGYGALLIVGRDGNDQLHTVPRSGVLDTNVPIIIPSSGLLPQCRR